MDLGDKSGLLVDDMPEMRNVLRVQLSEAGLKRCDTARNVKEAIDKISASHYDLVLCDYNLGQGADGQQLLELGRRKHILPLSTAFIIITGETGYEQVSTAAEYAPDDYLLKPVTAEILFMRLSRALEKKAELDPIYDFLGLDGNRAKAIAACDELLGEETRYALDVLRLKGDLLLDSGKPDEALVLFDSVLQQRSTPWAEVGKARALVATNQEEEARLQLEKAITAYPNYLPAYDTLSRLLQKADPAAAQAIVEQALQVSPSTQRQRELGALAVQNKDFSRAEEAYRRAVEKDRTGFFKTHDDYAGLSKCCIEQGKSAEALAAVKEMGTFFSRSPELAARQAALEAQIHARTGNVQGAKDALQKALAAQKEGGLDAATTLEIAQACFANGKEEDAKRIIQAVAEDHSEREEVLDRARAVFDAAGLKDEGEILLEATRKQMIQLNNDAVALAKAGEFDQAIAMLSEAADRLPNNAQVSVNAALALLMDAQKFGVQPEKLAQASRYIAQAKQANPDHPKLAEVTAFYRKLAPREA